MVKNEIDKSYSNVARAKKNEYRKKDYYKVDEKYSLAYEHNKKNECQQKDQTEFMLLNHLIVIFNLKPVIFCYSSKSRVRVAEQQPKLLIFSKVEKFTTPNYSAFS